MNGQTREGIDFGSLHSNLSLVEAHGEPLTVPSPFGTDTEYYFKLDGRRAISLVENNPAYGGKPAFVRLEAPSHPDDCHLRVSRGRGAFSLRLGGLAAKEAQDIVTGAVGELLKQTANA